MVFDPFAGLITQVLAYQPPAPKMRMTQVNPYDRITAVNRMRRGESPTAIAQELGCSKSAVLSWKRQAKAEASHG